MRQKLFFAKDIKHPFSYSQARSYSKWSYGDHHLDTWLPSCEMNDGEDLLSLFNQYSNPVLPNSDLLATEDALIINKASVEGISTTYHITVQEHTTTTLFDTGANMSGILQNVWCCHNNWNYQH